MQVMMRDRIIMKVFHNVSICGQHYVIMESILIDEEEGGVCSHLCLCIISMSIHPLMIVFHEISMLMSLKCATGKGVSYVVYSSVSMFF